MKLLAAVLFMLVTLPPMSMRANNHATVYFETPENVEAICSMISEGRLTNVLACANSTMMVVPNPCEHRDEEYAAILCHELGHVNGWRHRN